jgi:hypothetical protein
MGGMMTANDRRSAPGVRTRLAVGGIALAFVFTAAGFGRSGSMAPQGSPVPKELAGQWQAAIPAPPGIADYVRGDVPDLPETVRIQSSTLRIAFYFGDDGRYSLIWLRQAAHAAGLCGRGMSWDERGTVSIDGAAWTFQPSSAMTRALDSCAPTLTSAGSPAHPGNGTLLVTREVDDRGGEHLRLKYPSGYSLVLDKLIRN